MLSIFDEIDQIKADDAVEGAIPIGEVLILVGFVVVTIIEPS